MADIEISTSEVKSLVSEIDGLYDELALKINELNQKKETISGFWTSREATLFNNQLDKVSKMFVDFEKEYNNFVLSLNNFTKMYDEEEESFISSINNFIHY